MRLTEKDDVGYFTRERATVVPLNDDYIGKFYSEDISKLGQLEDIEEELGIDLITLFKALKNGVYYKYKPYGYDYKISKCRKCVLTGNRTLIVDRHTYKYLCDYGKTWALTKEELL